MTYPDMDADGHARRAAELVELALQPGTRARRAQLLATVAQVHATLAGSGPTAGRAPRPVTSAGAPRPNGGGSRSAGPRVVPPMGRTTLFERLKGQDGISEVVRAFYTRVLGDPQLTHYFEHVEMWRLQRHMVAFLVQATGGPVAYEGRDMATAHAGLAITGRDFDRVARHLVETLVALGVASSDVDEVVAAVGPLKQYVVTASAPVADRQA